MRYFVPFEIEEIGPQHPSIEYKETNTPPQWKILIKNRINLKHNLLPRQNNTHKNNNSNKSTTQQSNK